MKQLTRVLLYVFTFTLFVAPAAAQPTAEDFVKVSRERFQNRDLDGALAALDKAIELKPGLAVAYVERHRLHMLRGSIDLAIADVNKALLIDHELGDAYAARGRLRMMKRDAKGALEDFDNAIVRGYRTDEVYSSRATLREMMNDFAGALDDYNTAIAMNPNRLRNYVGRAGARSRSGDDDGALAEYNAIIDKFEQQEQDRRAAGRSERQAAPPGLMSPGIDVPESSSGNERTGQGKPSREKKKDQVGIEVTVIPQGMSAQKMEYQLNVAAVYQDRARIHGKRGEGELSIADSTKSIALNPFFGAYYDRGREFRKRGDLTLAIADFDKTIELQPRIASLYLERGATFMELGKDEEAEKDFARCLELDPSLKTEVDTRRLEEKSKREKKLD
jgi:tetratricopeptide (TPR) repeat protein